MMPYTSIASAATEISVPIGSSRGGRDSRVAGTIAIVPARASAREHDIEDEDRRPREPLQQQDPEARSPSTPPPAATPTQVPTALPRSSGGNMVVITDSVTGITTGGADAHQRRRSPISSAVSVRKRARSDAQPEQRQPEDENRLAADAGRRSHRRASSSAANGQRVGVDDPLQLRLRGAGVAGDLRQGHVQAGDGGDHHHQRQAHHAQHRPALLRLAR